MFQRIIRHLKARILSLGENMGDVSRPAAAPVVAVDQQRTSAIQNRLLDLDRRLAKLQCR